MSTDRTLAHMSPECPGAWFPVEEDGELFIACGRCGVRWIYTIPRERKAQTENYFGFVLLSLTREGKEKFG